MKLDMLGHDDPSMIRMLQDLTGVDPQKIRLDDPGTMSLFITSEALGFTDDPLLGPTGAVAIPEFNSKFTRGVLEETHPTQVDTLLRISGFTHGHGRVAGQCPRPDHFWDSKYPGVRGVPGRHYDLFDLHGFAPKRAFKIMESVRKGRGLPEGAEEEMKAQKVPEW